MFVENVNPLRWDRLGLSTVHRIDRIKSFQPPHGFDVSNFVGTHRPLRLMLLLKKRIQKPVLCFRSDRFIQNNLKKWFFTPVL